MTGILGTNAVLITDINLIIQIVSFFVLIISIIYKITGGLNGSLYLLPAGLTWTNCWNIFYCFHTICLSTSWANSAPTPPFHSGRKNTQQDVKWIFKLGELNFTNSHVEFNYKYRIWQCFLLFQQASYYN